MTERLYAGAAMVRFSGIHYWRGVIRRASDRGGIWECDHEHFERGADRPDGRSFGAVCCAGEELRRRAADNTPSHTGGGDPLPKDYGCRWCDHFRGSWHAIFKHAEQAHPAELRAVLVRYIPDPDHPYVERDGSPRCAYSWRVEGERTYCGEARTAHPSHTGGESAE